MHFATLVVAITVDVVVIRRDYNCVTDSDRADVARLPLMNETNRESVKLIRHGNHILPPPEAT